MHVTFPCLIIEENKEVLTLLGYIKYLWRSNRSANLCTVIH